MQKTTRYSKKREAILDVIRGTRVHPTAEWVYQTLKPTHPDLSLGTVYRNLALFREQGMIRSVGVIDGQEHFDGVMAPHAHFICSKCGAVHDLPLPDAMEGLDSRISDRYGFRVDSCDLTVHGLCRKCRKLRERAELM